MHSAKTAWRDRLLSTVRFARIGLIIVLATLPSPGWGQTPPTREIRFTTNEGTFVTVDVAPDGETIVFDLLGDLYTLPLSGGEAKPLTNGRAWHYSPRYSPDGSQIAFISDEVGTDNVWIMPAGGGAARPLTDLPDVVAGAPAWSADGSRLVTGLRAFSSTLHLIDASTGRTTPIELDAATDDSTSGQEWWRKASAAVFAPDGRSLYLTEGTGRLRTSIVRLDLSSRRRYVLTDSLADFSEFTPQIARSGRLLAYLRQYADGRTELRVRDLVTGEDRRLVPIPNEDDPMRGDYEIERPAYAFTPDDDFIVIAFGGKIHRIAVADGADAIVPFEVDVIREVAAPIRPSDRLDDGPIHVRTVRWPSVSRDGRTLVFNAVGYIWVTDLASGTTRRLTDRDDFEYMPALAPDGRSVAYVSFANRPPGYGPGRLMVAAVDGGAPRQIIDDNATYFLPAWSPDGRRVAFIREVKDSSGVWTADVAWTAVGTGAVHRVATVPSHATIESARLYSRAVVFRAQGDRLLINFAPARDSSALVSVRLDGNERLELAGGRSLLRGMGMVPSPDLSRVLVTDSDGKVWVVPLPATPRPARIGTANPGAKQVSEATAYYAAWQPDGSVTFVSGNRVYVSRHGQRKPRVLHTVRLTVPRRQQTGTVAFRGARLITMAGDSGSGPVVEQGTLVVRGRRIAAVGPVDEVTIPKDAVVLDALGQTIMPGLIDVHYHRIGGSGGAVGVSAFKIPRPGFDDPSAIAYGVTTAWEPGGVVDDGAAAVAELREAGRIVGPRWSISAAGTVGYPWETLTSYESAREKVDAMHKLGVRLLKEYGTPSRQQRQWLGEAARSFGLGIASHLNGFTDFMTRAADGYTGADHPYTTVPAYEDVRQFLRSTGIIWTPNLIITPDPGDVGAWQHFVRELCARGARERAKLERYTDMDCRLEKPLVPFDERLRGRRVAEEAAALVRAGGKVAASAHNMPGVLLHGELWGLRQGGLTTGEVLRAATMIGAEKIGLREEIGSLEVGKVADLLVLTENPLDDITSTLALKYTVADGVIYDSETVQELSLDDLRPPYHGSMH